VDIRETELAGKFRHYRPNWMAAAIDDDDAKWTARLLSETAKNLPKVIGPIFRGNDENDIRSLRLGLGSY
jgi:hypothetical protein